MSTKHHIKPLRTGTDWTAKDDGLTTEAVRDGVVEVLPKRTIVAARLRPEISSMTEDAYWLVKEELRQMKRQQVEGDKPISADRLQKLVNSLEKLQKSEIAEEQRANPTAKADEELLADALRDPQIRRVVKRLLEAYDE